MEVDWFGLVIALAGFVAGVLTAMFGVGLAIERAVSPFMAHMAAGKADGRDRSVRFTAEAANDPEYDPLGPFGRRKAERRARWPVLRPDFSLPAAVDRITPRPRPGSDEASKSTEIDPEGPFRSQRPCEPCERLKRWWRALGAFTP